MAGFISDNFIEEVLQQNDIVSVVSEYVRLEKKGKDYFGLCPFHGERTPSFSVVPAKQIFYCFGCCAGGNAIHFIMKIENVEFVDAVKILAEKAHMDMPTVTETYDPNAALKKEILELNVCAAKYYFETLFSDIGKNALQYLNNRMISVPVAKHFGLGYAPDEWHYLYSYVKNKGFSDKAIAESGLFLLNKNGEYYDRFRNRVIFPIFDIVGQVIAFGGRIFDNSKTAKYMNSPETMVYTKGRHLYALNFAKKTRIKQLILVEGYMDVVSLHKSGFTNAVASLGTALTENQARLIKKYAEEVIICYDADRAGQAATMRAIEILARANCDTRILTIDGGKDPDEYLKNNSAERFQTLLDNADSVTDYKIRMIEKNNKMNNDEDKISLVKKVAEELSHIEGQLEREIYIERTAAKYKVSVAAINELVNKSANSSKLTALNAKVNNIHTVFKENKERSQAENQLVFDQRMILVFLVNNRTAFDKIRRNLPADSFYDADDAKAAEFIYEKLDNNKEVTMNTLLNFVSPETASIFGGMLKNECDVDNQLQAIDEKLIEINKLMIDIEIEHIKTDLNDADTADKKELMVKLNDAIKKKYQKIDLK